MTGIHGTCHPDFNAVRDAFEQNFLERGDVGASVAVSYQGEYVVDLWGGHRDQARTQPWEEDTIVNVYSSTKTMAALCLLLLADRGEVDLYARVSKYWPEFAQNGKEAVEVRHFLSHSAGLSGMDEPMTGEDACNWEKMVAALERQAPWWEPGTASGYHAVTQGYLLGEVVRRVTGQTLGAYFRTEIAEPLGADFHIGTPREHFPRIAELIPPASAPASEARRDSIAARTFASPAISAHAAKTDGWRLAEIPAANGHGNARSIVRAQTIVANLGSAFGVNLLSEAGARRVFDEQTNGTDLVLGVPIRFGMGYGLSSSLMPMGPNEHIAYWGGWGGSTVVVDQDARLCVSYVMNKMEADLLGDRRGFNILQAAYGSLG
ncbi:MAG: serine hydrolase domain-containing protein [Gammaproteobacteria bacterium]|nr:serine hydrolase domain-containing protein [Gammaproteobacteria bacterium]